MNLNTPTFSSFRHGGLNLAFFDEGDPGGAPVLLIHGFASTANVNWVHPGWITTLVGAGRRVIALENPGRKGLSACVGWLYTGLQVMRPRQG